MSHRRSSRMRIGNQPPANGPSYSNSSSSVSSSRTERNTRSNNKQQSPRKSSTPHSLSSEDLEDQARDLTEPPLTRRRTRGRDHEDNDSTKNDDELDEDIRDEDEVTRCVCGYDVDPGPPTESKAKDSKASTLPSSDVQSEEAEGLFVQCDNCKVWQHATCVGFMRQEDVPEEYFCELCREDLHTVMTTSSGQTYSRFRTIAEQAQKSSTRKSSLSKEPEAKNSKEKEKTNRGALETLTKRRSTMNSRAAGDDDEVLRKVLEESKTEGAMTATDSGSRKGKRSRDESEEARIDIKRQRTTSQSPPSSPAPELEEDDAPKTAKAKPRGAAARSQREREQREKEREKEKAEAANKRKGRAERRRADDIELPEEPALVIEEVAVVQVETPEVQPPDTPTAIIQMNSSKKPPRTTQKRSNRTGKNQSNRETSTIKNPSDSPHKDMSPASPHSRVNGNDSAGNGSDVPSRQNKLKNSKLDKLSWADIKRSATSMHTYILQRQVELAEKNSTPSAAVDQGSPSKQKETNSKDKAIDNDEGDVELEKFKSMSSTEMMDYLSRDLVLWQQLVGAT